MSTNASITMKDQNKFKSIYCHWDGYITGVGKTLFEHYNTNEKVKQLIDLGNISFLEPSCDKPEGHTFETPVKGYTVAYGRDRQESNQEATVHDSLKQVERQNRNYYWDGENWYHLYRNGNIAIIQQHELITI